MKKMSKHNINYIYIYIISIHKSIVYKHLFKNKQQNLAIDTIETKNSH